LFTRYSGIPTDRARDTVPQLLVVRRWDAGRFGTAFWLCMTGFLKLSIYRWVLDAYTLLEGPGSSGAAILLGASIQLLGIWLFISGRVDLARSFAFLFGIRLAPNFDAPFESRNPAELWRRWNITLGAWLNEEIFIKVALALRRWKGAGIAVACLVAFLFCGALHGPIATNLAWGGVHGCYMAAYMLSRKRIRRWSQSMGDPRWLEVASVLLTFSFFVASSFLLLSSSMRSTARAIRSVWVGPFWPHQCQEVRWLPFAAAACVAMLLHSLPRRMGGEDAWLSSLGLRARICVGVAMAAGMFVAVSWA
jgi:D-alanyl-lipoteichoic acid acyltransferase DltB (MBOAT superfamily)